MEKYYKVVDDVVYENDVINGIRDFKLAYPNVMNPTETYMNELGYYRYVKPLYDLNLNEKGNIYFDGVQLIVTHQVLAKTLDLQTVKNDRIKQAGKKASRFLMETDIFARMELEASQTMPTAIRTERNNIMIAFNNHKTAIEALTTAQDVFEYEITY